MEIGGKGQIDVNKIQYLGLRNIADRDVILTAR